MPDDVKTEELPIKKKNDVVVNSDGVATENNNKQPSDINGDVKIEIQDISKVDVVLDGDKIEDKRDPLLTWAKTPEILTQEAIDNIRFDFNDGMRLHIPEKLTKEYRIVMSDADTGTIFAILVPKEKADLATIKKYYVRYKLDIYDNKTSELLFTHTMDLKGKTVVVQMPCNSLGDGIAWFSFMDRFQKQYECDLYVYMSPFHLSIFNEKNYPNLHLTTTEKQKEITPYATYYCGLYFKGDKTYQPMDFKYTGIHTTIAHILNIDDKSDIAPIVDLNTERQIKEPYVCIATQGSSPVKQWMNPRGWYDTIKYLKKYGYRVLCIDKEPVYGAGDVFVTIPNGAEDFTGTLPLQDRINILKDADFFIGGSSGLAWLAWCTKIPVVMISGFTLPVTEFFTPYRVINKHVCHGCWNDFACEFDHNDYMWCPKHKGTYQVHECTRAITVEHVINTINKIPSFQRMKTIIDNKDK